MLEQSTVELPIIIIIRIRIIIVIVVVVAQAYRDDDKRGKVPHTSDGRVGVKPITFYRGSIIGPLDASKLLILLINFIVRASV